VGTLVHCTVTDFMINFRNKAKAVLFDKKSNFSMNSDSVSDLTSALHVKSDTPFFQILFQVNNVETGWMSLHGLSSNGVRHHRNFG
jgi:hypothetical protein